MRERYRGTLLGVAVGDALGAPIEFMRWDEIRARYGPEGVRGYV
ncbi:MAG: ADP-ribosylglycohydrolase family protein, partial [Bacillota bacterium]